MSGWIIAALLLLVLLGLFLLYNNCFVVRRYRLQAPLPERDLRILLLSDLHNKQYGRGNRRLLRRIAQLRPDLIVIAGDLVDKRRRKGTGIGLYSVKERIAIYTGYKDSVKVLSKAGFGTIVVITIPKILVKDKNSQ